jgi:hypothetical protein
LIHLQSHKKIASLLEFTKQLAQAKKKKEFQRCHGEELKENKNTQVKLQRMTTNTL